MPIPDFGGLPPYPKFEDIVFKVNQLVQQLRNLLLNLDSLNVVSLTADHIDAGTLDAGKVTVHVDYSSGASITLGQNGITINNGTFDTFKADVNGEVTATAITIQSATGYPKIVMDPQGNLLGAYSDADSYIALLPNYSGGIPTLVLVDGATTKGFLNHSLGGVSLGTFDGEPITFQVAGNINLAPAGNLQINGINGISTTITYVKSVIPDGMGGVIVDTGQLTFSKGILTSAT